MNTKFRVRDKDEFLNRVFGADCFLKYWPEILIDGVELRRINELYYIMKDGKAVNDTAFFNEKEMTYLEEIETPELLSLEEFLDTFDDDFKQQVEAEVERLMKVIREPKI